MAWLGTARRKHVEDALIQAGLIGQAYRPLLFDGVHRGWFLTLAEIPVPKLQLQRDLMSLDETPELNDGEVPLRVYLDNAVRLADAHPAVKVLAAARDEVAGALSPTPDLVLPVPTLKELVVGEADFLPAGFLAAGAARARCVARFEVPRIFGGATRLNGAGHPERSFGTGWLIAPGFALTNHHVFEARRLGEPPASPADRASQIAGSVVRFDYDEDGAPGTAVGVDVELVADAGLDYSLVRLSQVDVSRGWLHEGATVRKGMAANIIQHPGGRSKQVVVRNNVVHDATDGTLQYFTDTEPGSSGSPVCDDDWRVLALHRASRPVQGVSFQGKHVAYVNEGTPFQAIRAHAGAAWDEVEAARQQQ